MTKKRNRQITSRTLRNNTIQLQATENQKTLPQDNVWWSALKKSWVILSIITAIFSTYILLSDHLKSNKEKFEDENIEAGIVESSTISDYSLADSVANNVNFQQLKKTLGVKIQPLNKFEIVHIQLGGHLIMSTALDLYNGVNLFPALFEGCSKYKLKIRVRNDRLYVSAKFIDIESGNEIGEIDYNHWILYKSNLLDYRESDSKFEVKDKHGNIAFSLYYNKHGLPMLTVAGYFVDANSVVILNNLELFSEGKRYVNDHNNECQQKANPNWRENAQTELAKIQSIFPNEKEHRSSIYSIVLLAVLYVVICGIVLIYNKKNFHQRSSK